MALLSLRMIQIKLPINLGRYGIKTFFSLVGDNFPLKKLAVLAETILQAF